VADVAAVSVEKIEALEAVFRQGLDHILEDGDQGARPQRHRAGEAEMVLRHADRDRRRDEGSGGLPDTPRDDLGADRVGADQAGWPVLLGRADRQDDSSAGLKISLDLLPSLQLKLHSRSFRRGFYIA
jgi:hypothetical protein